MRIKLQIPQSKVSEYLLILRDLWLKCNEDLIHDIILNHQNLMQFDYPQVQRQNDTLRNGNKRILVVICIYFVLSITSKFAHGDEHEGNKIKTKLKQEMGSISLSDIQDFFQISQQYQGVWKKSNQTGNINSDSLLKNLYGTFQMNLKYYHPFQTPNIFRMAFQFKDGEYIDQGMLIYHFLLNNQMLLSKKTKQNQFTLSLKQNQLDGAYRKDQILRSIQSGPIKVKQFKLMFINQGDKLKAKMYINVLNEALQLQIIGKKPKLIKMVIFAVIIFIASYAPFSAIFTILNNIYNGQDDPANYSLLTICLANMWDTVLCLLTFIIAFTNQENFILFIMPALLLCLTFTNLQPRFIMLVHQQLWNSGALRQLFCRFSVIHYGSLLLIYPILFFTNLNSILFLLMSCIIFPQIYLNGINKVRPNLSSAYYLKFIMSRFVLLLYLRCYPNNIFQLEPNYPLGIACTLLILFQYALLFIQTKFGATSVIPNFLLEPIYDYRCQEEINIEESMQIAQCSICLTPLHYDSLPTANGLQLETDFKIMKTPCNHKYHSSCLLPWMKIKCECPQCRAKLPPFK